MKKEIFEDPAFSKMADSSLVMVNADFPRNKKHQLAKDIQHQNELLADRYNPQGNFPYTLILDEDGKVLKSWNGLPEENGEAFAAEVKNICDQHK
jgi:hypothetical protein